MQSLWAKIFYKSFHVIFLGAFCLSMLPTLANAVPQWKTIRGNSICGGIDQNGRLQPPCGLSTADFVMQAIKRCPAGAIPDMGTCRTCPEGYERTPLRKINHERACRKPVPANTATANFLSVQRCTAGRVEQFLDGRAECWACDPGFNRVLTSAASDWNACGRIGANPRKTTQKWELTREGHIRQMDTGLCVAPQAGDQIILQACGTSPALEIWRSWAGH